MTIETPQIPGSSAERAEELTRAVQRAGTQLEAASEDAERRRALPSEIVSLLRDLGLFWLKTPREFGGSELDPLDFCAVLEQVAYHDASAAWAVMVGNGVTGTMAGWLPDAGAADLFAGTAPPILAGQYYPRGKARRVPGGYRVSGRWGFSSGIMHADWVVGGCRADDTGQWLLICAPKAEAVVHDVWHVVGLQGTGSNDFSLDEVFVPDAHAMPWVPESPDGAVTRPARGGPLFAQPHLIFISNELSPVTVGIARRALDDTTELADKVSRTASGPKLSERAAFRKSLGRAEATIKSVQLLYQDVVSEGWQRTIDGRGIDDAFIALSRSRHTMTVEICLSAVAELFRYGGGRALSLSSPMQRHYRNLIAAAQHAYITDENYEQSGLAFLRARVPAPTP